MGEFKPEDEGTSVSVVAEKCSKKIMVETKVKPVHDSQSSNKTTVNDSQISIKYENEVSNKKKDSESCTTDISAPVNKSDNAIKETVEKHITPMPVVEPHSPTPPPQPVKRKVRIIKLMLNNFVIFVK